MCVREGDVHLHVTENDKKRRRKLNEEVMGRECRGESEWTEKG